MDLAAVSRICYPDRKEMFCFGAVEADFLSSREVCFPEKGITVYQLWVTSLGSFWDVLIDKAEIWTRLNRLELIRR